MKHLAPPNRQTTDRVGFTLVELLVVISIIAILLTITLLAVNLNNESDRVKKGARQVQSFLLGARDRAIQRGEEVGVRFYVGQPPAGADLLTKQIIARQVVGMAYIGRGGTWPPADGEPQMISNVVPNSSGVSIFSDQPDWWSLKRRGWLVDGLRIRIPDSPTGDWFQIDTSQIDTSVAPPVLPAQTELRLLNPFNGIIPAVGMTYSIELPWSMLPEEPSILPENVVIDLDGSRIPASLRPTATTDLYQEFVDVIFSPRGRVTGDAGASGVLHFYVCDAEDSLFVKEQLATVVDLASLNSALAAGTFACVPMDEVNQPWTDGEYTVKPRRLVTVIPQTGAVSVHEVNGFVNPDVPPDADGFADDPFRFAETGETAN